MKYIDADKLIAEIERLKDGIGIGLCEYDAGEENGKMEILTGLSSFVTSHQQEQPNNMIQWTGNNLKEVIDFTGKSPRFEEWFKSWEEYENYVHTHNDILKLFCEDGSHYEVPVGAWIVKTPDGYNVPSIAKYIHQGQPHWRPSKDERTSIEVALKFLLVHTSDEQLRTNVISVIEHLKQL